MSRTLRVVVVAESPTDEAVAAEIVAAVRGAPVDLVVASRTQTRGWPQVVARLPGAVRRAHFDPTVDAVVVLADADRSPIHDTTAHRPDRPAAGCRPCEMRALATSVLAQCSPATGRVIPLKLAVGTPVPRPSAGKAWGSQGRCIRRARGCDGRHGPAREGAHSGRAGPRDLLRTAFPGGYGTFEAAIRAW